MNVFFEYEILLFEYELLLLGQKVILAQLLIADVG
jgi:hypothetical protein